MEKPRFRNENFRSRNLFVYLNKADENGEVMSTKSDNLVPGGEDDIQLSKLDFAATKIKLQEIGESTRETKETLATIYGQWEELNLFYTQNFELEDDELEVYDNNDEECFRDSSEKRHHVDGDLLNDNVDEEEVWDQALQGNQGACYMVEPSSKEGETEEREDDLEEDSQDDLGWETQKRIQKRHQKTRPSREGQQRRLRADPTLLEGGGLLRGRRRHEPVAGQRHQVHEVVTDARQLLDGDEEPGGDELEACHLGHRDHRDPDMETE